ncbi:MAG: four-helix bundle copper-binding protein [Thermomicrobiales bacterium]
MSGVTNKMEHCIELCETCHGACVETITHCLKMSGAHSKLDHIRLMWDCAEICALAADFMHRGSDYYFRTCAVCAEICARCADDCARFENDPIMRRCAEACRNCASACQEMAAIHA